MFKFEKGDPENLEGKVIIYASLPDDQKHLPGKNMIGIYAVHDRATFIREHGGQVMEESVAEKEKAASEVIRSLLEHLTDNQELSAKIGEENVDIVEGLKNSLRRQLIRPFYGKPIEDFDPNLFSLEGKIDIICAGKWEGRERANEFICEAAMVYFTKFRDQKRRKRKNGNSAKSVQEKQEITYEQFRDTSIMAYITSTYVQPLITAVELGDNPKAEKIQGSFLEFGKDSPFTQDITGLCKEIRNSRRATVIEAYVNKIDAVHLEDYERAARTNEVIHPN